MKPLKLSEARELTPVVSPVEAMRRQLTMAVYGGVSEADVVALTQKLKDQALKGDTKAMKMMFELIGAMGPNAAKPAQDESGLAAVADAITDLVDEIRITRMREGENRGRKNKADDE